MHSSPRIPVRTCVGCRRRDGQVALLRVVADQKPTGPGTDWVVRPDPERRRPGRGAYLHPDVECVTQAIRRGALGRALRQQGRPDTSAVERLVAQQR